LSPVELGKPVLTNTGTDNGPVVNNTDRTGTKIRINKRRGKTAGTSIPVRYRAFSSGMNILQSFAGQL